MTIEGEPEITEVDGNELAIVQTLSGGGKICVTCREELIRCKATDAGGKPASWGWELRGNERMKEIIRGMTPKIVEFESAGTNYKVELLRGVVDSPDKGAIRMVSDEHGDLVLNLSDD